MSTKKLSEHVEEELFSKEKRELPKVKSEQRVKLSEGVEPTPVKKKKPYYRKKYNKPKPVEDFIPKKYENVKVESFKFLTPPENQYFFIKGVLVGSVVTAIICHIIYSI